MELTRPCFGDPARAHEKKEEKTCKGCSFEVLRLVCSTNTGDTMKMRCALGYRHGSRCAHYEGAE